MTTTVTVKARAWGAKVTKGDETFELGAHEDQTFHLGETESLSVAHGEKPADEQVEDVAEQKTDAPLAEPAPAGGTKFGKRDAAAPATLAE